jgi:hypothetical protein
VTPRLPLYANSGRANDRYSIDAEFSKNRTFMIATFTIGSRHSEFANTVCAKSDTARNAMIDHPCDTLESWPELTALQPHDEVPMPTQQAQEE